MPLLVLVVAALAVGGSTGFVRRWLLRRHVLDVPNARRAHSVPTPRGGGIAIAGVVALVWVALLAMVPPRGATAGLLAGGLVVAVAGWADDRRGVAAPVRLIAHFVAAVIVVVAIGGMEKVRLGGSSIELGPLGNLIAVVGIVWAINLFNFMDGIDGLAATEAIHVTGWAALLAWLAGLPHHPMAISAVTGASIGFLFWNWFPARIFLGDVGSGLLGFAIGSLGLVSERSGGPPLLSWIVLFGVFVVDATATLLRRLAKGERWDQPHCQHAYQRLAMARFGHAPVTLGVSAINVVLGLTMVVSFRWPALTPWIELAAGAALVIVYIRVDRIVPTGLDGPKDG